MKIDKDGRITIEAEHEADTLYGVCIEIDKTKDVRDDARLLFAPIRRWMDAVEMPPELEDFAARSTFMTRAYQACASWWKSKANAAKPLGRPYDDSM